MFLDFFFGSVKFGEPKFTVLHRFLLLVSCLLLFLNAQFKWLFQLKTNNNLPPRIYCENAMDVELLRNKIIKYHNKAHHS